MIEDYEHYITFRKTERWTLNEACWLIHNYFAGLSKEELARELKRPLKEISYVLDYSKSELKPEGLSALEELKIIYRNKKVNRIYL